MMPEPDPIHVTVRALREEFDRSFAAAPVLPGRDRESLLTITVGECAYALRLAEIRGLHAARRILALPGALPELLGVAGFRGQIVPVYDLGALLGQEARHAGAAAPRWLVQLQHGAALALAFDAFDGHFSAAPADLLADPAAPAPGAHQRGAVRVAGAVLPIIHLPSLIGDISRRCELAARQRRTP